MLKHSSAPPRGPRNGSPGVRGGGIQKRRAGPARVDKDGDLVMDPTAAGGERKSGRGQLGGQKTRAHGPGRGGRPPARGGNAGMVKAQQAIIRGLGAKQANVLESRIATGETMVRVDGLGSSKAASNPDGGVESLLAFLERKASGLDAKSNRAIKIKKSLRKGDSVIITASPEDIAKIQKLDNFMFAGSNLTIKAYDPSSLARPEKLEDKKAQVSPSAQEAKERLRGILATRYDATLKLLNLSALAQDEGLRQMGVFDGSTTTSKIFPALMVVCDGLFKTRQEKRDAIVSVTLADNNLADVSDVAALAQTFPDLRNLDLSRNKLEQLSSLDAWRSKLKHLSNLVLSENPIETQLPTIKTEIMRRYPYLEVLNGIQIRTPDEIAAAVEASKSPIPIAAPDFRDVGQVGENFIRQFVVLYDNDRPQLLATFYDAQSVLSISVNMQAPRNPKISAPIPPWAPYTKHSRNLVKINNLPTQMSRIHRGSPAIQSVWATLPTTRHPDLQSQPDKYLIECHPLPGLVDPSNQSIRGVDGLIVTMHGEFEEQNSSTEQALRSFSRTFVLGPGVPGGSPIRVVSDIMVLRAWGPLALPRAPANIPEAPPVSPEEQKQQAMAVQLVERTGMTPNYAMLCLTETGWDLEKALIAFNANKDKLPPDAFIAGAAR